MKPLLESDASEFERGLLDAMKFERPSPELEQRMRAAIGLGAVPAPAPAPTAAPAAPAAPAAKTFGAWSAIAAGSVVAALVVGGTAMLGSSDAPVEAPVETPAVVAPSEPEGPAPTPLSELAPEAPAAAVERPNTTSRAPQKAPTSTTSASLREEIRLIDSARVAVKQNDGARAIGILDQYSRRFPAGTFREEARVLRAEALKSKSSDR
jgi:hypothetical protein